MKKNVLLFTLVSLLTTLSYGENIKAQLEAKAAQTYPTDTKAAARWVSTQMMYYKSIEAMSFPISKENVDLIKASAQKKYPLNFEEQEAYVQTQANAANALKAYEKIFGKDYPEALKAILANCDNDFQKASDALAKQAEAKNRLDSLDFGNVDAMKLEFAKGFAAKKYPADYEKQIQAIKMALDMGGSAQGDVAEAKTNEAVDNAQTNSASADVQNNPTAPEHQLTLVDLNNMAKKDFSEQTLLVDSGDKSGVALMTEIQGKKIILLPFALYDMDSGMSLRNTVGDEVVFNENGLYSSKDLPILMIIPESVPESVKPAKLVESKDLRGLLNKYMFALGVIRNNVQSYPVKISSMNDSVLMLSTKLPPTFGEGTLVMEPELGVVLSMGMLAREDIDSVNWGNRSDVGRLKNKLGNTSRFTIENVRMDKLNAWEKLDVKRFKAETELLEKAKGLTQDFLKLFSSGRLADSASSQHIGDIITKYTEQFKKKMDKSSAERLTRAYLLDLNLKIKSLFKNTDLDKCYKGVSVELEREYSVLKGLSEEIDRRMKSGTYKDLVPSDIKKYLE